MVKRGDMMSVDDVTEILSIPLLGIIPDDEQVVIGTNQGSSCDAVYIRPQELLTVISAAGY